MKLYDEEYMASDLEALLKAQLPAEIAIINADKNDSLTLASIANDKYVFETLSESMLNFEGFFLMYGISDAGTIKEASTGNVIEDVTFTVQIATFDKGEASRLNTLKKLLRYRRALRSVIINNPDVFRGYAKASLASLRPNAFEFNRKVVLTCGIDVKASLTAV